MTIPNYSFAYVHGCSERKPGKEIIHMRFQRALLISLMVSMAAVACAQDSKYFREKLGNPSRDVEVYEHKSSVREVYEHKSGVRVEIGYDVERQVCYIYLSDRDGRKGFDSPLKPMQSLAADLVPLSSRGALVKSSVDAGNCTNSKIEEHERALIIENQDSCDERKRGIVIYFNRDSCPPPVLLPGIILAHPQRWYRPTHK
jgi:hypothetical protein